MDQPDEVELESGSRLLAIRDAPRDILVLVYTAITMWGITFIWLVLVPDSWLDSLLKPEANVWLLVLSGVFFLVLAIAWIASWWPVILAVINCLLAVTLVLRHQPARVRWVCASAAAMLVLPAAMHFWPGGIDGL